MHCTLEYRAIILVSIQISPFPAVKSVARIMNDNLFTPGTGNTVIKAIAVLKEHHVLEENIILSNLFCTPPAAKTLVTVFPKV